MLWRNGDAKHIWCQLRYGFLCLWEIILENCTCFCSQPTARMYFCVWRAFTTIILLRNNRGWTWHKNGSWCAFILAHFVENESFWVSFSFLYVRYFAGHNLEQREQIEPTWYRNPHVHSYCHRRVEFDELWNPVVQSQFDVQLDAD